MNRHERKQWAAARTLDDLGELTAQWLEGRIAYYPRYGVEEDPGPDHETILLVPVLAALNRAGFLTEGSQPGEEPAAGLYDWQQRATVRGFADDATLARIEAAVRGSGLLLITRRTEIPPWWHQWLPRRLRPMLAFDEGRIPVTATTDGTVHTWLGWLTFDVVATEFDGVGREAFAEVLDAWQVLVIDPQWGRNDLLWDTLTSRFLAGVR